MTAEDLMNAFGNEITEEFVETVFDAWFKFNNYDFTCTKLKSNPGVKESSSQLFRTC
jgi:hypothetical protein